MPTPRDIAKKIAKAAEKRQLKFAFVRHGANHDVWSLDGVTIPIPRHREIDNQTAEMIYKECAEKLGRGWWRK